MQIAVLAPATLVLVNKELETSMQSLVFDITLPRVDEKYDESIAYAKTLVAAALADCKMTLTLQSPEKTETLIRSMKLADLMEASTNNEGTIRIDYDGADLRVRAACEIGLDGAMKLHDGTKLLLNIDGKVSAATMTIYGTDLPVKATQIVRYEQVHVNANVEKDLNVQDIQNLIIPVDTVTDINIHYSNGQQIKMHPEELRQRMFDSQDPVCVYNGRVFFGYMNFINLSVSEAWKVSLVLSAETSIYTVRTNSLS